MSTENQWLVQIYSLLKVRPFLGDMLVFWGVLPGFLSGVCVPYVFSVINTAKKLAKKQGNKNPWDALNAFWEELIKVNHTSMADIHSSWCTNCEFAEFSMEFLGGGFKDSLFSS